MRKLHNGLRGTPSRRYPKDEAWILLHANTQKLWTRVIKQLKPHCVYTRYHACWLKNTRVLLIYRSLVSADSAPYEEIGYATYMHFLPLPYKKQRLWRRALVVLNEQPCLLDSNSTSTTNAPRNPSQKGERRYFTHWERDNINVNSLCIHVPIAQRRPDFHTTILEKLNEKPIHENTSRMKRSNLGFSNFFLTFF